MRKSPAQMYKQLCRMKGPQDICCLDVFEAAVAQANDPDLPVEQSTKFELVINLKTAKALGLNAFHG